MEAGSLGEIIKETRGEERVEGEGNRDNEGKQVQRNKIAEGPGAQGPSEGMEVKIRQLPKSQVRRRLQLTHLK